MSNIPTLALERYATLRGRAEALRAANLDASEEAQHERDEEGRQLAFLQHHKPGRRLEVADDGTVGYAVEHHGQYRPAGPGAFSAEVAVERHRVEPTPAITQTVTQVLGARRRAADAQARQAEVARTLGGVGAVARACERLLRARGWSPSGLPEVRL